MRGISLAGSVAAEAGLDALETHLSLKLAAGLPPHLEAEGYTICGRPPSIQPGWCDQEQEALEAEEAYLSGKSVLGVLGATATGKTVFATYLASPTHRHAPLETKDGLFLVLQPPRRRLLRPGPIDHVLSSIRRGNGRSAWCHLFACLTGKQHPPCVRRETHGSFLGWSRSDLSSFTIWRRHAIGT